MPNKESDFDHHFKSRENNGEHRNGRLSQFKNHHSQGKRDEAPNEYMSKKEERSEDSQE
jgi:hypothetical protein